MRSKKHSYYLKYSLLFLALALFIWYFYRIQNKTLINEGGDGLRQYYRSLLYYSSYYRKILRNVFIDRNLVIPQWDYVIGEGNDILWTFHYYGINDPINLLSIFFNSNNLYIFYDISVFLRLYLAGIAFSEFCFYLKKQNGIAVLSGALLYTFSGFAVSSLYGHIYFINVLIYFPLVILGIEHIIEEDNGILLTISCLFASTNNIYFFYMIVLSAVIYSIIRVFTTSLNTKNKIYKLLRITLYSFLGVLIGSFIFLPVLYSMISNSRLSTNIQFNLFYNLSYYIDILSAIIYKDDYIGCYSILGFFLIIYLCRSKKNITEKIFLIVGLMLTIFPVFGYVYNAFTYVTYRWVFVLDLLIFYFVVDKFDEIMVDTKQHKVLYFTITIIYTLFCVLTNKEDAKLHIAFGMIAIALIILISIVKKESINRFLFLCTGIVCIGLVLFIKFSPMYWDCAKFGTDIKTIINISNEEFSAFEEINDETFYRYSGDSITTNSNINGSKSSTGYYWSVANNDVIEFRKQVGLSDKNNHHYDNYDDSLVLNSLASVKYYVEDSDGRLPFGYNWYGQYNNYDIYKTDYSLPLVYTYDSYIDEEKWSNLDLISKQEALTQGVVIDTEDNLNYNKKDLIYENTIVDSNLIIVDDSIAKINAQSDLVGEYYLVVNDLYNESGLTITVELPDNTSKYILYKEDDSPDSAKHHDFAINLGYLEGLNDSIKLECNDNIDYNSIKIDIVCLPLKGVINNLQNLRDNKIVNEKIENNSIEVEIETDENKIVVFSIPYLKGWKAYVDGAETNILKANIMYMGIDLPSGNHTIKLVYNCPLFKEGMICSVLGVALFVICLVLRKRKNEL